MKLIQPVTIWDNGQEKEAKILFAKAIDVNLNQSANFQYTLFSEQDGVLYEQLRSGFLYMDNAEYSQWMSDEFAWDFIANKLNLTITGDYVPPVPPVIETENNEVNNS